MITENYTTSLYNTASFAQDKSNCIVEKKLMQGQKIPFEIDIQGNVFQVSSEENKVKIIQDIFVKTTGSNDICFSLDGEAWFEFTELFTGNVGISFKLNEADPIITGLAVLNIRK